MRRTDRVNRSWFVRSAIEKHEQNIGRALQNHLIDGARDILIEWSAAKPSEAATAISSLINDEFDIVRRLAIYAISANFSAVREIFLTNLTPKIFNIAHLHELYHLLQTHFTELNAAEQNAIVSIIEALAPSTLSENDRSAASMQLRWLHAIRHKGSAKADALFDSISRTYKLAVPPHPDFAAYIETGWGPGPSHYSINELIEFAGSGRLWATLAKVDESKDWRGPTLEGLLHVLEQAVQEDPNAFLQTLADLRDQPPTFQHSILNGYRNLWRKIEGDAPSFWDIAWPELISCMESVAAQRAPTDQSIRLR